MRQRVLIAVYALYAVARAGSDPGTRACTKSSTRPQSISVPLAATKFMERSLATANLWRPPSVSGTTSFNCRVRKQHDRDTRSDL